MEFLLLFTFEGNIQWNKKGSTSGIPRNALTVINKIVFSSPEAMVEFSGEQIETSSLVKTLFER